MGSKTVIKVSDQVEEELRKVIQEAYDNCKEDTFYVGVSGGSFPKLFIETLKKLENIDWNKWLFFFCDERCVSSSSEDSTFGTFKRLLTDQRDHNLPISLNQFITIDPSLKSSKVADDYLSKMKQRFDKRCDWPRFHILFLGLGPDGHTCSLFPGHRLLEVSPHPKGAEQSKWVAYLADSPKPPAERITLTLPVINNSRACCFVATGESKAQVIKEILEDKKSYPAAMVQPHSGKLIWLMDKAAGSKLTSQQVST